MRLFLITFFLIKTSFSLFSQNRNQDLGTINKPTIDFACINKWPYIDNPAISNNGRYALYTVLNLPGGSQTLVIKSIDNIWTKSYINKSEAKFTTDSKFVIFKGESDSLFLLKLGTDSMTIKNSVQSFKLPQESNGSWLAYHSQTKDLVLFNWVSESFQVFPNVTDYIFGGNGNLLLFQQEKKGDSDSILLHSLFWLSIPDNKIDTIWQGEKVSRLAFDSTYSQLAFLAEKRKNNLAIYTLWYYKRGMNKAAMRVNRNSVGIDPKMSIRNDELNFSCDGSSIFFSLHEEEIVKKPQVGNSQVDVWSYKDSKIQEVQLFFLKIKQNYKAVISLKTDSVIRIEHQNETIVGSKNKLHGGLVLIKKQNGRSTETTWNPASAETYYLMTTSNGKRKILNLGKNMVSDVKVSPKFKYVVYYDKSVKHYFSYNVTNGNIKNISQKVPGGIADENFDEVGSNPVGIASWLDQDKAVLIYDNYDIWKIDPDGIESPINLTKGYGRKQSIKFRLVGNNDLLTTSPLTHERFQLLSAFHERNKFNGFFRMDLTGERNPELLFIGPFDLYHLQSQSPRNRRIDAFLPVKARDANVWIVRKMSTIEYPNFYTTHDFKVYSSLSSLNPQHEYVWITAELIKWKSFDGTELQGILYKPENFDSTLKYPIIFNFYERRSDEVYRFFHPEYTTDNIDIPYFVSNGYLVFVPDIQYKIGKTGENACNSVVSAAKFCSKYRWIDSSKMAIQGHSFGGYEVNYLVTCSNIFAAAASIAGTSDCVSDYGSIEEILGSYQFKYETGQYRLGATLWEKPEVFIKNSPVFFADKVATPLLMCNNKKDYTVRFEQGVEFFIALRRLQKKVWMLQYDQSNHVLTYKDGLDYTIRLRQFFDHYLKDAPASRWLTQGIPADLKQIETGYDLDPSGNCGKDCKVCKMWNERMKEDSVGTLREIQRKIKAENWIGGEKL